MRIVTGLACLVLLAGCTPAAPPSTPPPSTSSPTPTPTPSPSPSPSPSPTPVESFPPAPPSEKGEKADIRAGWEAYESAMDLYYRDPDLMDWTALNKVTSGRETSRAIGDIVTTREMNIKQRGDAIYRDVVIGKPKTDSDGVRSAVVTFCFDPTQLDLIDTKTGDPVPRTSADTLVSQVTMQLFPDGSWLATGYASEIKPC